MQAQAFHPIQKSSNPTRFALPALVSSLCSIIAGYAVATKGEWVSAATFAALSSLIVVVFVLATDLFSLRTDTFTKQWTIAGFVIRALYAVYTVRFYVLDDEWSYLYIGGLFRNQLLSGGELELYNGYPIILGSLYLMWGDHLVIGRLVNCIIGTVVLVITYKIALSIFESKRVARIALVLVAIHPDLVVFSAVQVRDIFVVLFGLGLLWATTAEQAKGAIRLVVFVGSGLAFIFTRAPHALAFLSAIIAYMLYIAWHKKQLRTLAILLVISVMAFQFWIMPWYQSTWSTGWKNQYSMTGTAAKDVGAFSGISRQMVDSTDTSITGRLLSVGRQLFIPLPIHILSGINVSTVRASLYGLLWYTGLPLVGLAGWYHRRNAVVWLLVGLLLGHLIMLSNPVLAFGGEPLRWRLAILPVFAILSARGYVAYTEMDPVYQRTARHWLIFSGITLVGIMGLYAFLAL